MNEATEWASKVWANASRDVISAVGTDTERYLHSQLAQQIEGMSVGDRVWSLLLEPTGKVIAVVGVTRHNSNEFSIDCDPGDGEQVLARLQRFRLRVDAELTLTVASGEISDEMERSRVHEGWPRGSREIVAGETIPAELPMLHDLVSFTKGCYPGQELVERMDARNSTSPFEIIRMVGDLPAGSEVVANGEVVGTVTSVAGGVMLVRARRKRHS